MDEPIFYKAKRFFPNKQYEEFSKIFNRAEIVTYDICLCENLTNAFDSFGIYVEGIRTWQPLLQTPLNPDEQIIAYYKNPTVNYEHRRLESNFEFCGYDLAEDFTGISALTNCGNLFDRAISYEVLNKFGIINDYHEAFQVRKLLSDFYPDECHAQCEVYELWRRL